MKEGLVRDYDMTYRTKNGENIPATFSGSVMRDKECNLIGIVCIAHEMRKLLKVPQELEKQKPISKKK